MHASSIGKKQVLDLRLQTDLNSLTIKDYTEGQGIEKELIKQRKENLLNAEWK